jgi:glycosyltransferase involved in cell wall biosynthesis
MKILFVDPLGSYGARTSSEEALGGTQSAVTYLALALARAGVGVIVANRRSDDAVEQDVAWMSLARLQQDFAARLHAQEVTHLVVVSAPTVASLRPRIAWNGPWVLWNHHWIDQPALAPLSDPRVCGEWDAFVSLSAFHHQGMTRAFGLPAHRHFILRNAIAPHFASLFADWDDFRAAREGRATTRFVYTSAPFRGLDVLAQAWRTLGTHAGWSCTAISGMQLYRRGDDDASFAALFADVAGTPGMTRLPPMGQAALARVLAEHDFWGYPCTFVETSCISALEAVAAGLHPVTTSLGALPETLEGWGSFVSVQDDLAARWSAAATTSAERRDQWRIAWLRAAWERRERVLREWTWERRAQEWIACLDTLVPRAQ